MTTLLDWNALHPLVVHFPIGLLLTAPILVVIGLALRLRAFLFAALVVMAVGVAGAWVAVATGEAAGEIAERLPAVEEAVEEHGEHAETSRALFTALTAAYAALLLAPVALKRPIHRWPDIAAHVAFLFLYAGAALHLARAAHEGGLLVHRHGIHASLGEGTPAEARGQGERHRERD